MASPIHTTERRERRGRWFAALALLLSIAVLSASWLGLFTFMTASAAAGTWQTLDETFIPEVEAGELVLPDLSQVSRIYSADGQLLATLHDGRVSEPVTYEEIPLQVTYAILAAEDEDFFAHEGVDMQAIMSAAMDNIVYGTQRGGSTITQQVVKQNFVGDEISYKRKVKEALTAIELERRYPKENILEFYMNSVYFGYSAYGVKAAAQEYFGKELSEVTVADAATLAMLLRSPGSYDPRRNPDLAIERRDDVVANMLEEGWITQAVADEAFAQPLGVIEHQPQVSIAEHVVAEVRRRLLDTSHDQFDAALGSTSEERKVALFGCPADDTSCTGGGGLEIHTTIDLELQQAATDLLNSWLPTPDDPEVQAPTGAIAMVDNWSGAVRVMASGLPFGREQFDLAVQGRRNPGSSFKPIALVAALEAGQTLGSYWDSSSPKTFECEDLCFPDGIWEVSNAGGGGAGLLRLDEATYRSVNVVYAGVALEIGADKIVDVAQRMGVTSSELTAVPSIALGGSAVSPLEMASAYTHFATNGEWTPSYLVERIERTDGSVVYAHESAVRQSFDPALFAAARQPMLRVPTSSGTAVRADLDGDVPQGGKTGTHQEYRDAWYVGFVPNYSTAVWVGYPDEQRELRDVVINGERYSRVFGGSVPAPIWKDFMEIVLAGEDPGEFPPDPPGIAEYFKTPSTEVPFLVDEQGVDGTGAPVVIELEDVADAILAAHLAPNIVEVNSTEPVGTILSQSPAGGTSVAQGTSVTVEVSTGIPPEFPLPNLVGQTLAQVDETLQALADEQRLQLAYLVEFRDTWVPAEVGRVLASSPTPGTIVGPDTGPITLIVGRQGQGPPPTTPPPGNGDA